MKKVLALVAIMAIAVSTIFALETAKPRKADNPQYEITVTQSGKEMGKITLELWKDLAPKHVANFEKLVAEKFYDGVAFHRCMPGFMIQGGDPNTKDKPESTWGKGDPSQPTVPAEFSKEHHNRGILSAARKGGDVNSATSQFFICVADVHQLDNQYTVYGQVLRGMEVADKIIAAPVVSRVSRAPGENRPVDKITMTIKKIK
jgi:peptidyl-prolyl cis-trans isomerase B (cyclophilin B)